MCLLHPPPLLSHTLYLTYGSFVRWRKFFEGEGGRHLERELELEASVSGFSLPLPLAS